MPDGSHRRRGQEGQADVVVAHDFQILRHPDGLFGAGLDQLGGDNIVAGENPVHIRVPFQGFFQKAAVIHGVKLAFLGIGHLIENIVPAADVLKGCLPVVGGQVRLETPRRCPPRRGNR